LQHGGGGYAFFLFLLTLLWLHQAYCYGGGSISGTYGVAGSR
jgi:hypothetical protein